MGSTFIMQLFKWLIEVCLDTIDVMVERESPAALFSMARVAHSSFLDRGWRFMVNQSCRSLCSVKFPLLNTFRNQISLYYVSFQS